VRDGLATRAIHGAFAAVLTTLGHEAIHIR
jgi:hypothetical protein